MARKKVRSAHHNPNHPNQGQHRPSKYRLPAWRIGNSLVGVDLDRFERLASGIVVVEPDDAPEPVYANGPRVSNAQPSDTEALTRESETTSISST